MYRYYESCVCGSSTTMEAPTSVSYEWKEYVRDWRESHKHESRPYYGGIPVNPVKYEQINVDVDKFEDTLNDN